MTLATEYTKACGLVGAHQLVSGYICCVIGNVMRDASTLPKGFNLPGPFPLLHLLRDWKRDERCEYTTQRF